MASVHITGSYAAYDPGNIVTRHIEKRKQETPLPYDGTAWRLLFYAHDLRSNTLELGVSRGRYSEYRFTSLDEDLRKAVPDPKQWFTALALGILAITDDEKFLVFRRPSDAHLSPNTWDLPCGHPSTDGNAVGLHTHPSARENSRKRMRIRHSIHQPKTFGACPGRAEKRV